MLGGVLFQDRVGLFVDDEHESLGVRRPGELRHATTKLGHSLCLAPATIEQPYLRALPFLTP